MSFSPFILIILEIKLNVPKNDVAKASKFGKVFPNTWRLPNKTPRTESQYINNPTIALNRDYKGNK